MFRLAPPDQVWSYPVPVSVPAGDGQVAVRTYTARFAMIDAGDVEHLSEAALIRKALRGWDDIEDADGTALAFSPEALERLLRIHYWRRSTMEAYVRFARGLPEKNSVTPPGDGGAAPVPTS